MSLRVSDDGDEISFNEALIIDDVNSYCIQLPNRKRFVINYEKTISVSTDSNKIRFGHSSILPKKKKLLTSFRLTFQYIEFTQL